MRNPHLTHIYTNPYASTSCQTGEEDTERNDNRILPWFPSDTEARFNENLAMRDKKKELEAAGWYRNDKITEILYRVNEFGFRGDSLSSENISELQNNCVMFLGCSNMFGVGEFEKNTIPEKFKAITGENVVNLGQPGGSLDACVRVAMHWVPLLKPKAIFLLHPPGVRREIYLPSRFDEAGHQIAAQWGQWGLRNGAGFEWCHDPSSEGADILSRSWTLPEEETVSRDKNMWALRGLANQFLGNDHIYQHHSYDHKIRKESLNKARDLMHNNHLFYEWFANSWARQWMNRTIVSTRPEN